MLVVIIILKLKTGKAESFLIFLIIIRFGKNLISGSPTPNEVDDIVNH